MVINDSELNTIYGGKTSMAKGTGLVLMVGMIITFIIGVIDGYKRPLVCN